MSGPATAPRRTAPAAATVWAPEGTSRGTVAVLTGRGEHPGIYARLGCRLASDGWTVAVPGPGAGDDSVADALAVATGARVLLGSDTGALRAWGLAASGTVRPDGLVLAGLPTATSPALDHEGELDARTACPVHRGVLEADPDFGWGALAEAPPPVPAAALPDLPVLWLHGDADPIAPAAGIRALARPADDVAVVADGVHDVLNDQFHRIVAARLVLFLERLAKGARFAGPPAPASGGSRTRRAAPLTVSARLDHALAALAELVDADGDTVTCDAMSRARGVPLNSLVNVMLQLRRAGLVTSRRGCEGGYRLARRADEITVADVVRATEGAVAVLRGTGPASLLWADLERTVAEFLTARTLTDLERSAR
ncbi:putative transcriptional regulator of sulfate adenylyltransferase, Rrf2 family [Pseudonocardia sp. Ae168_Ps1]|uniref:Rrf2 family transcriptional regulator n=1 Tax=unclassified Pseudonocardia TaxID=2619320 RepID=UPI00094AFCE8|nr:MULTISPECIES: Rrf2 family transcriptional regulator [unclassified Pseudonocardia]OLL73055.1 putative Lysophospholipase Monoglyceride lipase [Pseudonocardia sp. Ae150A_Ps1]OLL79030.1 putative transcriptional regulator of sulfate adenylyltransferase, Rrf2 family [Pseudonocardia sp. Ae168_Ps1]OLL86832.1 putative transcriptional regulator of sulfate adenylyltransferase, Rrf2 family [Pseudonocardia sp. Ae263_Ps1]OLL93124.1 putative Lysophospholipase, Monoglyceride lipase [Pseudonocardia sp. Ae356